MAIAIGVRRWSGGGGGVSGVIGVRRWSRGGGGVSGVIGVRTSHSVEKLQKNDRMIFEVEGISLSR